jgi:hypothetical protein
LEALTQTLSEERICEELGEICFEVAFFEVMPVELLVRSIPEILFSLVKISPEEHVFPKHSGCPIEYDC